MSLLANRLIPIHLFSLKTKQKHIVTILIFSFNFLFRFAVHHFRQRFMYLDRFVLLRWQKNYASPRLTHVWRALKDQGITITRNDMTIVSILFFHPSFHIIRCLYTEKVSNCEEKIYLCKTWQTKWCFLLASVLSVFIFVFFF